MVWRRMFEKIMHLFSNDTDDLSDTLISYGDCGAIYSLKNELGGNNGLWW